MAAKKFLTIDEYHSSFPIEIYEKLELFRRIIREVAPGASEVISYNMPAFKLKGIVVYYSAFKKHISLFPAPGGKEWEKDFEPYPTSGKGTIQFPYDKQIPVDLIRKIVKYRVDEDLKRSKGKMLATKSGA